MITKAVALKLRNETIYSLYYANADGTPQRWRVNGQVKTWKTRPNDFRLPIKRGMREFGYIDQINGGDFTTNEQEARQALGIA